MAFKFNPLTGQLDLVDSTAPSDNLKKIASENISALKLVYVDLVNCYLGDNLDDAKTSVVGVAINSATTGNEVEVKTNGELQDSFFAFPFGDKLFLGVNGDITNTPPVNGTQVCIGHSLGIGAIFINIESEIIL